jgi:hypothetical protein
VSTSRLADPRLDALAAPERPTYSLGMRAQRKVVRAAKVSGREPKVVRARRPIQRDRERALIEGEVVEVLSDENVVFVTSGGRWLTCACAMGIDLGWLQAALRLGAVRAEGSVSRSGKEGGVVWCLVPTAEQRRALPEQLNLAAAEGVNIVCGKSKVKLAKDGSLRVRGREVAVRGSRSTRILGGIVRLN